MSLGPSVNIAGAGVLGLAVALRLADAGARVTVFDPGGSNASSVAAGMLAPVFEAVLDEAARPHLDLLLAARDLWPALAQRAGIALDRTGALAVGDDDWLESIQAQLAKIGQPYIELDRSLIDLLAPEVVARLTRALLVREDWRLDPLAALPALRTACLASGVVFREAAIERRDEEDVLVLACGYAPEMARVAPELAQLTPIQGHIIHYYDAPGPSLCLRSPWGYAVRASEGLSFGATMEVGVSDRLVSLQITSELFADSSFVLDTRESCAFGCGIGVRAATPDGLPMVGRSETTGVMLAAGSRRNGWLLAPLVADMVCAYVMGRDPGPFAARLDPGRFGGKT